MELFAYFGVFLWLHSQKWTAESKYRNTLTCDIQPKCFPNGQQHFMTPAVCEQTGAHDPSLSFVVMSISLIASKINFHHILLLFNFLYAYFLFILNYWDSIILF